jgi:5-methylcytosine-specific restriction endonuclease McrA
MNMTMALFMAQQGTCFYCACDFEGRVLPVKKRPRAWTTDHVKPLSKGNSRVQNAVLACQSCNVEKRDREPTSPELARAKKVWASALRYLRAFNGSVPPALGAA